MKQRGRRRWGQSLAPRQGSTDRSDIMAGAGLNSGSCLGGNFGVSWNFVCSFQPKEMAYVSIGNNRDGQAADPTKEEAPPRTAGLVFLGNS